MLYHSCFVFISFFYQLHMSSSLSLFMTLRSRRRILLSLNVKFPVKVPRYCIHLRISCSCLHHSYIHMGLNDCGNDVVICVDRSAGTKMALKLERARSMRLSPREFSVFSS